MLKRKRSFLSGGLTSSCRIKAEALARAFNSRIWPCTWRSIRGPRQDEGEEFYEASSADDEDECGGRDLSDPCLAITSEQGRAKFCELLHAVDDATDVFYDVSEHAGRSGGGKVSERPIHEVQLHESVENTNCVKTFEKSSGDCSKFVDCCDTSSEINVRDDSSNENSKSNDSCQTSNEINAFNQSSIECSKFDDSVINTCTQNVKECLSLDNSCDTSVGINVHKQSSNECLYLKDMRDNPTNCETSKDINDTNDSENECMSNQVKDNIGDCFTISQNMKGADKLNHLDISIERLIDQDSSDSPSKVDSGTRINGIHLSEKTNNLNSSSQCLKDSACENKLDNSKSEEIVTNESTVIETKKLTFSNECLNSINDDLLSPSIHKSTSEDCIENPNFNATNSNQDNTCNYVNSIDTTFNPITATSSNNISMEHTIFSQLTTIKDNLEHNITPTMDIVDHDTCSFNKEELLTVIIDSNSFEIHQTPHNNSGKIPSSTDHCLLEQSHMSVLPPECSAIINDQVTRNLVKNSNCPSDENMSNIENDCVAISEVHDLERSINVQSPILASPECLKNNNDQEAIISLNPVLIEITKEESSPIRQNEGFKFSELNCLENKDDCRLKVFEENRPMISRSTSLKTGKTPPGTPSRKKIVRFADVLGLDLEDVRHIISGDLPNIPPSAYSDLALANDSASPTLPQPATVELNCRHQSSWESLPVAAGLNALYPLFAIPGQQPDFMERLRSSGVCLESVVVEDCNVQCTCRVMNWGYNKRVLARYTTNGWSSSNDINASYVSDSTRDGTDSFAFNIFLNRERSDLQFAIRYEINGNEYWDNNGGKNYCFSYHSNANSQTSVPCSPTWMEQFW